MKLYAHQKTFLLANPNKALLAWEVNCGKTLAGVEWLRSRQGNAIVISPKKIKGKWKTALGDVQATIYTKEEFKKISDTIKNPTALVADEIHHFSSGAFLRTRSQLTTAMYNFIKKYPDMPVLGLSATMVRSNPANFHTLLCYIGQAPDWKSWRKEFYTLERRPFLPRPAYFPVEDWRIKIRTYLVKHASIALMKDCMDIPKITEKTVLVPSQPFKVDPTLEVAKRFTAQHRHEQLAKVKAIREIAEGHRKVMIAVFYTEQIEALAKELAKDRQVYVLNGKVKDQEAVIKQAEQDDECYFLCQSGMGEAFDAPSFNVLIFASMS